MILAVIFWLVLFVFLLIVEAASVALVSLWFAAGCLVALVIAWIGAPFWLQITGFLVVSAGLLLALRPLVRKFISPKITRTNTDAVIGSIGIVTAAIDNVAATGQVKVGAMYWSARSSSGEPLAEGAKVQVDRIEGVKVFVSPAEIPETAQTTHF